MRSVVLRAHVLPVFIMRVEMRRPIVVHIRYYAHTSAARYSHKLGKIAAPHPASHNGANLLCELCVFWRLRVSLNYYPSPQTHARLHKFVSRLQLEKGEGGVRV